MNREALLRQLTFGSRKQREAAAASLVSYGATVKAEVIPLLVAEEAETQFAALRVLSVLPPDDESIRAVSDLLDAKTEEVRVFAILVLARYGAEARSAIPSILARLESRSSEEKLAAVMALGESVAEPKVVDSLMEVLRDQDDAMVHRAAYALARLRPRGSRIQSALKAAIDVAKSKSTKEMLEHALKLNW